MIRFVLLSLLTLAPSALGATRIVGTIYDGLGGKVNGYCAISWPGFTTFGGRPVVSGSVSLPVRNGVLDITLEPNNQSSPNGVFYRVQCSTAGIAVGDAEWWVVPDSAVKLAPAAVRVATGGAPPSYLGQLAPVPESPAGWADAETPGVNDAPNTNLLAHAPNPPSSLILTRNGLVMKRGIDYVVTGSIIYWLAWPQAGDIFIAWYRY